jgi:DNA-binding SARP family transcriptional activator
MGTSTRARPHAASAAPWDAKNPKGDIVLATLNGFALRCDGFVIELPLGAQRLMAFLALHNRPLLRSFVAGSLWPDTTDQRAGANLRSALWRLNQSGYRLVSATSTHVRLNEAIIVDITETELLARAILAQPARCEQIETLESVLHGDFLPGWDDDWVLTERERFRQLRLHALEALCEQLTAAGRYGQAVQAGLAAVAGEPLRESAHRAVIKAYLAEGNRSEALRQYAVYRRLAHDELGVEPSAGLHALLRCIGGQTGSVKLSAGSYRRH